LDDLGAFLNGDTFQTLQQVLKSRIAENVAALGDSTMAAPEGFLRTNAVSEDARTHLGHISRLSICLDVLAELKGEDLKKLTVVENITIEPD
jgi:hypothetical protein